MNPDFTKAVKNKKKWARAVETVPVFKQMLCKVLPLQEKS